MQLGHKDINRSIFKAYDIRGLYPQEIDDDDAYRIARAFVTAMDCKRVVVGHDMRESAATFEAATCVACWTRARTSCLSASHPLPCITSP